MRIVYFVLVAFACLPCTGQSFIIDDAESYADFSLRKDDDRLACFYKTWNSDKTTSHYRTISFDENLNITDTISYRMEGICSNLCSGENAKYSYHIFHKAVGDQQTIAFLVTDKFGRMLASYEKTAADFSQFFEKRIKKLSELAFINIKTSGEDAGILLLRPSLHTKSGTLRAQGNWMAMNLLDGSFLWQIRMPVLFLKYKAVAGKLVTLERTEPEQLFVHYYDLTTGEHLASVPTHVAKGKRTNSVFVVDSTEVVLAGSDFGNNSRNKHPHFFLTRFDMMGHMIFDHVDTTERLSGGRLELLGGAFKRGDDFVVVGESYKLDPSMMIATGALAVTAVLVGSPYIPGVRRSNPIVNGIVTVRISANGEVKEFNNFPVDHRNGFSHLLVDDNQIYLRYKEQLWWYDPSNSSTPPRRFSTVSLNESVIAFSGNLIGIRKDDKKREILLETLVVK